MNKRTIGILALLAIVVFYTLGTGFAFFYRFLYVILLLLIIGLAWSWLNLQGIEVRLSRLATRGQVGGYLEGQIQVFNRWRLPKSWLEVREVSDLPGYTTGRGIALVRDQTRSWRVETYLSRRGVFHTGQIEITSQDPFGMFRLRRRFLEPQVYTVLPSAHPLPNLDPRFAFLPSDSRVTRHSDHITPETSNLREYAHGDSLRQIHWPYTARMNRLMVKEFDMGLSAEAWVVLDMQRSSHLGDDPVDNTEELSVSIAASIINRLEQMSIPVGLATTGNHNFIIRPDSNPYQLGQLMEALAEIQAQGNVTLERFIYDLRPHLSRFNTLTVVTPTRRTEWIPALASLRRQGVNVSVVHINPQSFGAPEEIQSPVDFLLLNEIPTYRVQRGQALNEALSIPLQSGLAGESRSLAYASPAATPTIGDSGGDAGGDSSRWAKRNSDNEHIEVSG